MKLLELKHVTKDFGGLRALNKVSVEINEGEIIGLIGPNGAGKTTLFNVVSGFYKPSEGSVLFKEGDITQLKPFEIACRGLVRTFQENNLFHDLSVEKNVLIGCYTTPKIGFLEQLFRTSSAIEKERSSYKKTEEILDLLKLKEIRGELAKNLPHGFQRILGVAIALATEPELLLLDEPFSGMNAEETSSMMVHIREIRQTRNVGILLVEHDMKAVMGLCDFIFVLNFGQKIAEGSPEEIQKNQSVIEAYLGASDGVV